MTFTELKAHAWLLMLLAVGACAVTGGAPTTGTCLIPEYRNALDSHPDDLLAYFRAWLHGDRPAADEPGTATWSYSGSSAAVTGTSDRLLAGYEAFCNRNQGQVVKDTQAGGLRCIGPKEELLAQLTVEVLHAKAQDRRELRFTVETGARVQHARASRYRQVADTLAGNGPGGDVLLASGEVLEVARFGRLAAPDAYAVQLPDRGVIAFTELLSVRWNDDGVRVMLRDGTVVEEGGTNLTPARTLVRLVPAAEQKLEQLPLTRDAPLRFVTIDGRNKMPRQVRLRDANQLLKVTVSHRPTAFKAGPIDTQFQRKERDAFTKSLVTDARKASSRLSRKSAKLDLQNPALREEVEKLGRSGPCAKAHTDTGLKTGDLALSEFFVCAQYRAESTVVLKNGGDMTPDKTPLMFLSKVARAPWYNFDGVMR
jgi:hypothetical protein